jgi:HK97 family phage portal protein
MALLSTTLARARRWVGFHIAGVKAAAVVYPEAFRSWFSPVNIFGRLRSTKLASSETVFAVVSKLSGSMASLPVGLFDAEYRRQWTGIARLLAYGPNKNMHRHLFIRTLEAMRNTAGNGYALKEYGPTYQLKGLRILDPEKVEPMIDRDTHELWYRVDGDAGRYYVHNLDMIHVSHTFADTGYKGISPLDVLTKTLDFDTKVKEFSLEQIEGSVHASFILKLGTMLDTGLDTAGNVKEDSKLKSALDAFKNFYINNGGVLIEHSGMTITPIEQKFAVDTKVFDVEKITRKRVAEVFGMPDPDATGYNSREQEALKYVQDTIVPIVTQYEAEFDRKLLTPDDRDRGLHFKFNITALLRGDMASRMDFYFKGVRTGLFKPNECRAWEELPPEDGGDELYMSRDISPIGSRQPKPNGSAVPEPAPSTGR